MEFHDEFLTILAIKQNQNNLVLRLDVSDWFIVESYKDVVLELELIECQNIESVFEELKSNIGELIWNYEFLAEEKKLDVLMDNGDTLKVGCNEISETRNDLTIDELLLKFQWLAENYQRESKNSASGWGKYQKLRNLFKRELNNEIQNWERKKNFFEKIESANVDKAETIIKLCNRFLNYINQVEKE
jgi:hypothetical protein